MLRCKTVSLRSSNATMALSNWPGLLWLWIFKFTWVWITVTSISATSDLFSAFTSSPQFPSSEPILHCGKMKKPLDGTTVELSFPSLFFLILFCASREWSSCSSSFTKSIAPPIIEAWSPLILNKTKKASILQNCKTKDWNFIEFNDIKLPFEYRRRAWETWGHWDGHSFGVSGCVPQQCGSCAGSLPLLCSWLVLLAFAFFSPVKLLVEIWRTGCV